MFLKHNDRNARLVIDRFHQPETRVPRGKCGERLLACVWTAFSYVHQRDLECDNRELLWVELMPLRCVCLLVGFIY